tara:strand:+ start:890 stop:1423 length:534 start_codon:yes stop_codon:yes gene_type:complete
MIKNMAKFYSTKTYGNDKGLSCCFRQWGATHSHCSLLHGYSIGIKIIFECEVLDERNWVMDFGGLKEFKAWLDYMFDHTLLVAKDDPHLDILKKLDTAEEYIGPSGIGPGQFKEKTKLAEVRIVDGVGCEKFAEMIYQELENFISVWKDDGTLLNETVRVTSVEVFEHAGNSAIYQA